MVVYVHLSTAVHITTTQRYVVNLTWAAVSINLTVIGKPNWKVRIGAGLGGHGSLSRMEYTIESNLSLQIDQCGPLEPLVSLSQYMAVLVQRSLFG